MSDYNYDYDRDYEDEDWSRDGDAPGEFGFDYDNGDVLYHYGDGIAVGSDGKKYIETGDGFVAELDSGRVHYAPAAKNDDNARGGDLAGFYIVAMIACVFLVFGSFKLLFKPDTNALRWIIDIILGVAGVLYFGSKLRQ